MNCISIPTQFIHSRNQPNRFSPNLEVLFRIPSQGPVENEEKKIMN